MPSPPVKSARRPGPAFRIQVRDNALSGWILLDMGRTHNMLTRWDTRSHFFSESFLSIRLNAAER
jgi:hypothetical protein